MEHQADAAKEHCALSVHSNDTDCELQGLQSNKSRCDRTRPHCNMWMRLDHGVCLCRVLE